MSAIATPIAARAALTAGPARSISARKVVGGVSLRPSMRVTARPVARRADRLIVRAEEDGGLPDALKDLMKPPDASVAAPGWLAPLIGLAEEAGEDAPVVGYGIMGATGVFFAILSVVIGLGAFGFLLATGATGYACWQASPYLSVIASKFDAVPPPSQDSQDDE